MVGKEKLLSHMKEGFAASKSAQTEIVAFSKVMRVVRFANSFIHQPMEERNVIFFVRVLQDGKIGSASVNGMNPKSLIAAVQKAQANAKLGRIPSPLHSFALPSPVTQVKGFSEKTANTGADAIEEKVGRLMSRGEGKGVIFNGVFWTTTGETAVLNSNGVNLYQPWTAGNCQAVVTKQDLSGFSAQASSNIDDINPEHIGDEAVDRTVRFADSQALPPGDYTCLLEEYAVSELLLYLSHMAFTADALEEGRSVLNIKQGKSVADSSVTICDNALNPHSFSTPFDVEGTPKKRVMFVDHGIGEEVVYDLTTANRLKKQSTGHALPDDYSEGPVPMNLEMEAGKSSKDEMIKQIKRGLLVTRFHYIREVHPVKTMVTGMTRDGVYLVENGEVVSRVKNFRFTESILGAFSKVMAISKERKLLTSDMDAGFPVAILAPKVLLEKFAFTGATKF